MRIKHWRFSVFLFTVTPRCTRAHMLGTLHFFLRVRFLCVLVVGLNICRTSVMCVFFLFVGWTRASCGRDDNARQYIVVVLHSVLETKCTCWAYLIVVVVVVVMNPFGSNFEANGFGYVYDFFLFTDICTASRYISAVWCPGSSYCTLSIYFGPRCEVPRDHK